MSHKIVVEKLRGRENYDTWKIAAKSYLTINGYWSCVKATVSEGSSADVIEKHDKALSELILMIDSTIYSYVDGKNSLKEAWETLEKAFSDSGTCRKVLLLQQWINTKLNECSNMEEYVNKMTTSWARLKTMGFKIDEEVGASVLLAGLPNEYKPMILGLEQSTDGLTMDFTKNLLLQGSITEDNGSSSGAFFTKHNKGFKKVKCFKCGGPHFSKKCTKKGGNREFKFDKKKKPDEQHVLFSALLANGASEAWFVDSGASSHMTRSNSSLINMRAHSSETSITVANNGKIAVKASGDLLKKVLSKHGENEILIKNVQYVPDLCTNLLSVAQMVQNGNTVVFNRDGCIIYNANRKVIATASLVNNMFKLDTVDSDYALSAKSADDVILWHRRMGHLSLGGMQKLKNCAELNVSSIAKHGELNCIVCAEGKQCRNKFKVSSEKRANDLLQLIHSDVCGPMHVNSMGGARYYVTFIDDYSRKVFVYIMKNKNQAFECFVKFKNFVENQLNKNIKILRTDNGTEFVNNNFSKLCESAGILHQKTCVYTPQQNGLSERCNRTIMERARCLLYDSKLPKNYWAEAVLTAVKLINSSYSSAIGSIPDEIWFQKPVDYSMFRVFGCRAMALIPKEKRKKLDRKSLECIFLGYSDEVKGYRLMQKDTKKLLISRDVVFFENELSDGTILNDCIEFPILLKDRNNAELREEDNSINGNSTIDFQPSDVSNSTVNQADSSTSTETIVISDHDSTGGTSYSQADNTILDPNFSADASVNRSDRPVTRFINALNPLNYVLLSVSDVLGSDERDLWKAAIIEELDAHKTNHTWDLVDLPAGRKPIKSKWVFKRKNNSNGTRYKARLVVKGCSQIEGIDYDEIYAPVVRYASIRYLISLAAQFDLDIYQMDAITAFLQGELTETIYMLQPEHYDDGTNKVCLLRKSIYGLKQASRVWNLKLRGVLISAGFRSSHMDPCLFFKIGGDGMIFIAIYVDDVLYFTNSGSLKTELQHILTTNFKMKDMGTAEYCVGLNITRDRSKGLIFLDQTKYINEVLEKFNMANSNSIDTPSDPNQRLKKGSSDDADFNDHTIPYQQAVGSLMYLTQGTRPDLAFAINNVCRYNTCYTREHWTAVKRILRYLHGTANLKLTFGKNANHNITGFTDADWGADVNDRKSVTGFVFTRSGGSISWCSKKQPTVALSTAEAEYMALSACTQEAMWLKQLDDEIFGTNRPMNIFCDNQSAIQIAENNGYSSRSKHIDLRHHFVREKVIDKSCILHYVNTNDNLADALTKALFKQKFAAFVEKFGLI